MPEVPWPSAQHRAASSPVKSGLRPSLWDAVAPLTGSGSHPTGVGQGGKAEAWKTLSSWYAEAGPVGERAGIRQGGSSKLQCDRRRTAPSSRSKTEAAPDG